MQSPSRSSEPLTFQFWLLASFLALVFLTGGASRVDAMSLVILRPASVLICAIALLTLRREHWRGRGWLLGIPGAIFGLAVLHVVPLPPEVWQVLPGRSEIAETDRLAGLGDVWRPLTLTPMNGLHALSSLFAPLAVILIGLQLRRDELYHLLPILLAFGALSGFLGLLQIIGGQGGPLYFYRITNSGSAVGLFANRNHAAVLLALLFPMLAIFASNPEGTADKQRGRRIFVIAIATVILPLIFVTGSRAGLVFAVIGLLSVPFLYRRPVQGRTVRRGGSTWPTTVLPILGGLALLIFTVLMILFSRAPSIDRLLKSSAADDSRMDFWKLSTELVWKYSPVGSGAGSFAEVFQVVEPGRMLNNNYVNHAHNDWLEVVVTYGLPGLALMAICLFAFLRRSAVAWRKGAAIGRTVQFNRLATVLIAMLILASIPDYPLRTPIMMCVIAIAGLWLSASERADGQPASAPTVEG